MKLQKIVERLQKLHPKEIDLSLDRIKNLCQKLGNPQNKLECIQVAGTNGKYSTIQTLRAILKEAEIKCNIYTSPHVQKINERFIYDDKEISDNELATLLNEVEEINAGNQITYFEILTAAFFYGCKKYSKNLTICEFGLFARFDAVNILKNNLASIVTAIGLDHLDWLPKGQQNIKKIIFEKTSSLLSSKIIVAKQNSDEINNHIINTISNNPSEKIMFNKDYNFTIKENDFFYYEDQLGALKLPKPNLIGDFQLENVSTAIATARNLVNYKINDDHIINGITKIKSIARLQEIKEGKLKSLIKNNQLFVDGSHNPLGAKVLNQYLESLNCKKHIILGMMANKDHNEYMSYFKNISSLTTIDIPNQPNAIKGKALRERLKGFANIQNKNTIEEAIVSVPVKENDIILITGSLYLAGEILNLN